MTKDDLQPRCELGQQQLMRTEYLDAEATLAAAEADAWRLRDFDTLSRLYMPLQEARRQRRQVCGEGVVCLDLIATGPQDAIDGRRVVENFPHGQLLVAGWGSIEPALRVRALQREHKLYIETFLAAVYPVGPSSSGRAVVITPSEDVALPDLQPRAMDDLIRRLPAHCIVLGAETLPVGTRKGDTSTYAEVMAMWEQLHAPFLAAADATVDPVRKIEGYRLTQRVDYGCELAHQKASDVARELARAATIARGASGAPPARQG
ncbi:MAG: hypothetical protein ABIP55_02110 [Tepidisphaeraceae bacterium]